MFSVHELHSSSLSATQSDFDAVLDRVGLEGGSDEVLQSQVTDDFVSSFNDMAELATEADVSYGIPTEKEEKMMAAARSDLVKLLQLPVSVYKPFYIYWKYIFN